MTQEIGTLASADDGKGVDFSRFPVGSVLFLLPYHSCATAACYPVPLLVKIFLKSKCFTTGENLKKKNLVYLLNISCFHYLQVAKSAKKIANCEIFQGVATLVKAFRFRIFFMP